MSIVFIAARTSRYVDPGASETFTAEIGVAANPYLARTRAVLGLTSHAMNFAAVSGFFDFAADDEGVRQAEDRSRLIPCLLRRRQHVTGVVAEVGKKTRPPRPRGDEDTFALVESRDGGVLVDAEDVVVEVIGVIPALELGGRACNRPGQIGRTGAEHPRAQRARSRLVRQLLHERVAEVDLREVAEDDGRLAGRLRLGEGLLELRLRLRDTGADLAQLRLVVVPAD